MSTQKFEENSPANQERSDKPEGVRAKNRQARLQSLSDAALKLFLTSGIEAVTIDQIVGEANMAKGTFYRYFQDKEAIVGYQMEKISQEVNDALLACRHAVDQAKKREELLAAYQGLAQTLALIIYGNSDLGRLYLQESRGPDRGALRPIAELSRNILEHSIKLTKTAQEHGLQRTVQPEVSARAVVGATEALILASLDGSLKVPASEAWTTLISLVVDGLRVE
jgi:AcrR family transcriptional regulator